MIREVCAVTSDHGRIESLELSCGHTKTLSSEALDNFVARCSRDRAALTTDCTECEPVKPEKFPKMKPIPLAAAKRIAEEYGYDQVIIYGRRCHDTPEPHGEHLTTYGRTKEHCGVAAKIGDKLKQFMGWNA